MEFAFPINLMNASILIKTQKLAVNVKITLSLILIRRVNQVIHHTANNFIKTLVLVRNAAQDTSLIEILNAKDNPSPSVKAIGKIRTIALNAKTFFLYLKVTVFLRILIIAKLVNINLNTKNVNVAKIFIIIRTMGVHVFPVFHIFRAMGLTPMGLINAELAWDTVIVVMQLKIYTIFIRKPRKFTGFHVSVIVTALSMLCHAMFVKCVVLGTSKMKTICALNIKIQGE